MIHAAIEKEPSVRRVSASMAVIVAFGLLITTTATLWVRQSQLRQKELEFRELASAWRLKFEESLHLIASDLEALSNVPRTGADWNASQFRSFAEPILQRNAGIAALEWRPLVGAGDRAAFEEEATRRANRRVRITQVDPHGEYLPAGERDAYFPIRFVEPMATCQMAIGADLAGGSIRRAALERARDAGTFAVSALVKISRDLDFEDAVLVISPVYRADVPIQTAEQRRQALAGFCVAVVSPAKLMRNVARSVTSDGLAALLIDASDRNRLLAEFGSGESTEPLSATEAPQTAGWRSSVAWADRNWVLSLSPTAAWRSQRESAALFWTPIFGSIATMALAWAARRTGFRLRRLGLALRNNERQLADARDRLKRSEQNLAITLQSIGDGVVSVDLQRRVTHLNPAAESLTGWSATEAAGKSIDEVFRIFHEVSGEPAEIPIALVLATGERQELANHVVLVSREGKRIPIADSAAPIKDAGGKLRGVVLVFRNVERERLAERQIREWNANLEALVAERSAKLRQSERRYRMLFDQNPHPIWVYELDSLRIVDVNETAIARYGYSKEQFLELTIADLHPPQERDAAMMELRDPAVEGRSERIWRHTLPNGNLVDVELFFHAIEFQNVSVRLALAIDVSARLAAEAAQRQSEANRRAVWDSSLDGIITMDHAGLIIDWNPAAERIFGFAREEALGRRMSEAIIPHRFRAAHENGLRRFVETGESNIIGQRVETSALTADGSEIPVELTIALVEQHGLPQFIGTIRNIAERKSAEETLRQSEANLARAQKIAHLGSWEHEFETGNLLWSEEIFRIFGIDHLTGEMTFERFLEMVHPDDRPKLLEARQSLWAGADKFNVMHRIVRPDGSIRWIHELAEVERGSDGRPIRLTGVAHDQTAQFRSTEVLQESERRYRLLFEHNPMPMYVYDRETLRFLAVNEAAVLLFGYGREEFLRMTFDETIEPERSSELRRAVHMLSGPLCRIGVFKLRRNDGEWIDVEITVFNIEFEGRSAQLALLNDISERIRAETALRESEQRYRYVLKATNDAIWDWDLLTGQLLWGEGFEALFGYNRNEMDCTLDEWSRRVHPEDRERVNRSLQRAIDGDGSAWSDEYRFLRKDGGVSYVLDRGYVLRDSDGKAYRMIGGMSDVTMRKELEAQLLHSQKMEAIGLLAGGIAHDFNNLLTVIRGYCDMLLDLAPGSSPMHAMLSCIREANQRATNLTRQLLAFSRKQVLDLQIVNLNETVVGIRDMISRLIGENIVVKCSLQPQLHRIRVDPGQLEQVIVNLAVNARDAMPKGGELRFETADVCISADSTEFGPDCQPGNYVALTVSDTGCGMPPEVLSRIFEPFFTTKEPGQGTGLGLSTVFGIVKQSDGAIVVESRPGGGARFQVLFPAIEDSPPQESIHANKAPQGNETILIVEDEASVRNVARLALESNGYRVLEASNGAEALKIIRELGRSIALVVTDVIMPVMGGDEFVAALRREGFDFKLLFISGYTENAFIDGGGLAGRPFLQKPFSPISLARKVRELLDA